MKWQTLEESVRDLAALKWSRPCVKETITGVEIDGVIRIDDDNAILIQITKNETLGKFRKDILDIELIRRHLFDKNYVSSKSYIITEEPVSSLMQQTCTNKKVQTMTFNEFRNEFFDYSSYYFERSKRPFGSAVEPDTGGKESNRFIKVGYNNKTNNTQAKYDTITKLLTSGKKVVLKGEYGTGKSRLIQSLFEDLNKQEHQEYIFAIDLRDYKGVASADELIRRHLRKYGLSKYEDSAVKCLYAGRILFIVDGFDEVAIQSWSENPKKIVDIRFQEFGFIRELLQYSHKGFLITGREHFFNDDEEMIRAIGLKKNDYVILESKSEFTETEINEFKKENNISIEIPKWFPKKPMAVRLISDNTISDELIHSLKLDSPFLFWVSFFDFIAERDSNANKNVLDPDSIKQLLIALAHHTRNTEQTTGPFSLDTINMIFKQQFGYEAVEESAAYLQRLPGMGRVKSDSYDRTFTDEYFLDFLRVEKYRDELSDDSLPSMSSVWKNILSEKGLDLLSNFLGNVPASIDFISSKAKNQKNSTMALELISACLQNDNNKTINFNGLVIDGGEVVFMDFSNKEIFGLTMEECLIHRLGITSSSFANCAFRNSYFPKIYGVSSKNGLPQSFDKSCSFDEFEQVSSIAKVKGTQLSPSQQYLVLILQKVFNQKGAGRKEEVLTRGFDGIFDKKLAKNILNLLVREDILTTHPGDEGLIYKANRKHHARAESILEELSLSKDQLWAKVSQMK
ncbi:MAG TPA: NACHT domain-containing protein [Geobacteraceae bacterium]